MKDTCYLRIGKSRRGLLFNATTKESPTPLTTARGDPIPTVTVKLNLELPADLFGPDAEADITVPEGLALIVAEVEQ